ncbi:unnamed protein product [Musa hybrid cultivar]
MRPPSPSPRLSSVVMDQEVVSAGQYLACHRDWILCSLPGKPRQSFLPMDLEDNLLLHSHKKGERILSNTTRANLVHKQLDLRLQQSTLASWQKQSKPPPSMVITSHI